MSLDISLRATVETTVLDKNITGNLAPMWREAGVFDALYESEGLKARDVLATVEEGLALMKSDPDRFRQFDAPNGWGTYEHAVSFLEELVEAFTKHPDGTISVWR